MKMKKRIRQLFIALNAGLLTLSIVSARFTAALGAASATPGPKSKTVALLQETQAGHSDGILILGIMIFIIIAIPILVSYRNTRSQQDEKIIT